MPVRFGAEPFPVITCLCPALWKVRETGSLVVRSRNIACPTAATSSILTAIVAEIRLGVADVMVKVAAVASYTAPASFPAAVRDVEIVADA